MVRIPELIQRCQALGMPAVAVTDQNNLFGVVKFYKAAMAAKVKPIIGADLWLYNPDSPSHPYRLTALCQNAQGYKNLMRLISRSYTEGQYQDVPMVKREWLAEDAEGLIILSGAREGDVGQALLAQQKDVVETLVAFYQKHFPNRYYLELQRTFRAQDDEHLQAALKLANAKQLPVVATNDVRFLMRDDFEAHEARVCIHDGYVLSDSKRPRKYNENQFLKSQEEMRSLFQDIPEALQNTVEIYKRCNVHVEIGKTYLPNFPVPESFTTEDYLTHVSNEKMQAILQSVDEGKHAAYDARLATELNVINSMGFAGYFLIVADFIAWAKENNIPVGPGRGSGAGSLVAYVLGITGLDPLQHELLFERFLNPERVSMPDFDIDFCMDGRDQVIDYVAQKYGRNSVSQIITFGTMAARAVVRDVGRVLGHPYGLIDKIAKLIPFEIGMTLDKALQMEVLLRERYNNEEETRTLLDLAKKCEGLARNAGKHAGGVVISPSLLTDFTPLYCEQGSEQFITQFDKDDVEAVGLVKFDFLGLRTLTIIKWAVENIHKAYNKAVDIDQIPMDDEKTYDLLKSCQTLAVFQLESRGMRDLVRRLQPEAFEEIVALVALFRPGPLQSGMVDDFIDRKHGRAKVTYPHPDLEPILRPTHGVILYQEQVMQIAQVLAGYTLGGADILRRAMGKKKPEEMAEQRAIFMKGAIERDVNANTAKGIFDLMEKFAGYGFNRSHSAGYALIAYQTAWLKAHYPAAFMAAVLSSDMDNTDKVVAMINECRALELKIIMPDINISQVVFTVGVNDEVIYGLAALKGVGQSAIEEILSVREQGPFENLFSLCERVDMKKVNRRVLEALIKSGALDSFNAERSQLFESIDKAIQLAEQAKRDQANKQTSLFAHVDTTSAKTHEYVPVPPWSEELRLSGEKEVLGMYVTGHPLDRYRKELDIITTSTIKALQPANNQLVVVAGLVIALRTMNTKRGDRMAFMTLDDNAGSIEIAVFADSFAEYRDLLIKDQLLIVEGEVSVDDYSG
ncbi:MAG: DNA polymerase III subunit alpha, partial [Gammaproteobacteria bacterium]